MGYFAGLDVSLEEAAGEGAEGGRPLWSTHPARQRAGEPVSTIPSGPAGSVASPPPAATPPSYSHSRPL